MAGRCRPAYGRDRPKAEVPRDTAATASNRVLSKVLQLSEVYCCRRTMAASSRRRVVHSSNMFVTVQLTHVIRRILIHVGASNFSELIRYTPRQVRSIVTKTIGTAECGRFNTAFASALRFSLSKIDCAISSCIGVCMFEQFFIWCLKGVSLTSALGRTRPPARA